MRRKIHLTLISEFNEFSKMQCSKIKEECPNIKNWWTSSELHTKQNLSLIAGLSKTGKFNRFSEESKKTIHRLGKLNWMHWEKFRRKHSARHAPSTCLRGTAILHIWFVLHSFLGTEAQDQKSIRDLVFSVLHRENGLLTRSKTCAEPMAI